MEGKILEVMRMLKTASTGNHDSLTQLGFEEGFQYEIPTRFNPEAATKEQLREQICDLVFFAEAANRLYMDKCKTVARKARSHMIHSYFCLFDSMPNIGDLFSGQDLSLELVDFTKSL